MKSKLHKSSACPECGGEIEFDAGSIGSYDEQPQDPYIACTKCDWSPDMDEVDWEYAYSHKPTPEQQSRIDALYIEIEKAYELATHQKMLPTLEDLFAGTPEGDFDWEGEPEDVGNAYDCEDRDCPQRWHINVEYVHMGRENGKRWFVVYHDSVSGCGDYQPIAGFDERCEGDEATDAVLADLWWHCEGRLLNHFKGWAQYNLHCAQTGEDPLNDWWHRSFTCDDVIKSAERNLEYLQPKPKPAL